MRGEGSEGMEAETGEMCFEEHQPRGADRQSLEAEKGQETILPWSPQKGAALTTLDSSPVTQVSDFSPAE